MRRVGDEAPFRVASLLERGQHPVERVGEAAHLVVRLRNRQPAPRVAGALDLRGCCGQALDRSQRPPHQHGRGDRRERGRGEGGEDEQAADVR